MRINVYSQELTSEIRMVYKRGTDDEGNPATFKGIRMMLVSPDTLHHTPDDDDRSAITLWLPKSSHRIQELSTALYEMSELVQREVSTKISVMSENAITAFLRGQQYNDGSVEQYITDAKRALTAYLLGGETLRYNRTTGKFSITIPAETEESA